MPKQRVSCCAKLLGSFKSFNVPLKTVLLSNSFPPFSSESGGLGRRSENLLDPPEVDLMFVIPD